MPNGGVYPFYHFTETKLKKKIGNSF